MELSYDMAADGFTKALKPDLFKQFEISIYLENSGNRLSSIEWECWRS